MAPGERVTESEFSFIVQAINQLQTVFELVQMGGVDPMEGTRRDVSFTMNLPLFKTVWEKNKIYRGAAFVEFIDGCLAGKDLDKPLAKRPNLIHSTIKKLALPSKWRHGNHRAGDYDAR
jgi:hypothetical protein